MPEAPIPYGRQEVDDDDVAAVAAVLRSDWLTTGPAVEAFERALAACTGGHPVVTVNSGTAALHIAYAAAGLGPGDRLLTTPLTFASTATTALHLGARVDFADIDPKTLLLDPSSAAAMAVPGTSVITLVDLAGMPCDPTPFVPLARGLGARLVSDASHSLGASVGDRAVGDLADLTTLSFHPVKPITTGEGGAIVVRDTRLEDSVRNFRNHGLVRDTAKLRHPDEGAWHQEVQSLGLNYRMPDILAALGLSQLSKLRRFHAMRTALADRYRKHLADVDGLVLPLVSDGASHAWHLFAVRVLDGRRREVFDRLRAARIGVQVHYLPVYLHPLFEDLGYRRGSCPNAEAAYEELLSLPLFPRLTEADQDRIIGALRSALQA